MAVSRPVSFEMVLSVIFDKWVSLGCLWYYIFLYSLQKKSIIPTVHAGTIPPVKSPLEKNDDVKKLFSIGSPVILVTVGVALLFIIRKKRKEKRLKRLRGEWRKWKKRAECRVWQKNRAGISENLGWSLWSCIYFKRLICVSRICNLLCSLLSPDAKSLAEMLIR